MGTPLGCEMKCNLKTREEQTWQIGETADSGALRQQKENT